jgi:serine/threonine protein kinase
VAPEVLSDSYTCKCDIWSIGVIAHIILCGFAPFSSGNDVEIVRLVKTAKVEYPSPEWDTIFKEAKDFVQSLL